MHGSAYWPQEAKTFQSCLCPAVGVGTIFANHLWVEAPGIQSKSAITHFHFDIGFPRPSCPALEYVGTLDKDSCWLIFVLSLPSSLVPLVI